MVGWFGFCICFSILAFDGWVDHWESEDNLEEKSLASVLNLAQQELELEAKVTELFTKLFSDVW